MQKTDWNLTRSQTEEIRTFCVGLFVTYFWYIFVIFLFFNLQQEIFIFLMHNNIFFPSYMCRFFREFLSFVFYREVCRHSLSFSSKASQAEIN